MLNIPLLNIKSLIANLTKKRLIILLVALGLLGVFFLTRQSDQSAALELAEAKRQDIKTAVSASGNLTGKETANLKFKTSGRLAYLNVKVGEIVSSGQVIAGLDTQDLSIKLQQAQNTLRDKRAVVDKTLDEVKDHDDDETFTQREDRTAAEVARDNAFDAVKDAQRAFQDAVIVSPISGIVTQAPSVPGQVISLSDLVAQVVDSSIVYFDAEVDEVDIGQVSLGQKSEVSLDAYPDRIFDGVVDQIIPQTTTTSSGATIVTVRIRLHNPPVNFISGLTGQTEIITAEMNNALAIPIEALGENNTVFIQAGNGFEPKKIVSGIQTDINVEIKEGLTEGQKVLLNPPAAGEKNQNQGFFGGILRLLRGGQK